MSHIYIYIYLRNIPQYLCSVLSLAIHICKLLQSIDGNVLSVEGQMRKWQQLFSNIIARFTKMVN